MPEPARGVGLAIVEDEDEVRDGLRYLLGLDGRIRVVGAYPRAEDLFERLGAGPDPDIVLMDIHLPGMSGIEATRRLRAERPVVAVIMLTIFELESAILDSIKAGAVGYILKNTRPEALADQVLSAREGSPVSPAVARRLLEEIRKVPDGGAGPDYGLTPREVEVLADVVDGLTYRELAERRHISGSTAKKHILHIYQKLNVSSRAEIVRKALSEGLVPR